MGKMGQKLSPDVMGFIEMQITGSSPPTYEALAKAVTRKYGIRVSKATISKRAKALNLRFRRGRKRTIPIGKRPPQSIFLDCAGAFFLKGAELEIGLLRAINRLLETKIDSIRAKNALRLAQQINALLLYAPIFDLKNAEEIAGYRRQGLRYLTSEKKQPAPFKKGAILHQKEINQYVQFLSEQNLLLPIIKEVTKVFTEALFVSVEFAGQTFFLDAQGHTVWPNSNIPHSFSVTVDKTSSCVKETFLSPSAQRPLVLEICPGYTFLPNEMFNLIQCLQQAHKQPISQLRIMGKFNEKLTLWQGFKAPRKCFFLAPLSPWQYARLQGTRIIRDFRKYHLGPEREAVSVADADIYLFNPQLNKNIKVRAALVRRQDLPAGRQGERLALITNISRREERYISKIAEAYFSRWPAKQLKNYYDLLEEAHAQALAHPDSQTSLTPLAIGSYRKKPMDTFRVFLEHLHRYTLNHFFPSEYAAEDFAFMYERFYQQGGYLKMKGNYWEVILRSFPQKKLQESAKLACQKFNQSGIELSGRKRLRISLQEKQ